MSSGHDGMWHLVCIGLAGFYWWLFCFGCCLRSVTWGSHDDMRMKSGRRWYRGSWQWAFEQSRRTSYVGMKSHALLNWIEFIYLYYTTGNISDLDDNAEYEAKGLFEWIYVIIGTDFCSIRVFIIIGFSKVKASPNNPDWWRIPSDPLGYSGYC